MDFSGDKTGSTAENVQRLIRNEALALGVAIPAIVDSFDPATQIIEATPVIRRRVRADDGTLTLEDRPKQIKIPMSTPYVRQLGFSLTMPLSPGDQVILMIQDRGIDLWQETGEISDPPDLEETRAHQYTDAIYVIGPIDLATPIEDYQIDSAELRNRTRSCAIQIWDDKAQVRAPLTNSTTWTAAGSVETFAPIDIEETSLVDNNHTAGGDMTNLITGSITQTSVTGSIAETAALGHSTNTPLSIEENAGTSFEVDAGTFIKLEAGATITLDGSGKILIDSALEVEITAPSVKVSATSVDITSPVVNMSGNLNVTGTVIAGGFSGPASAAASFTNGLTTDSAEVNGVEVDGHTHEESGGGQTGPME